MSIKGNALKIKKDAEIYAETCFVASRWHARTVLAGLIFAFAAALSCFSRWEVLDMIFTVGVVLIIGYEAVVFGMAHWQEDSARGQKFEKLAGLAGRLADGDPSITAAEVEEEAAKIEPPVYHHSIVENARKKVLTKWKPPQKDEAIFDSDIRLDGSCFEFREMQLWKKDGGLYGETGTGTVTYAQNTLNITRTNAVGRVRLILRDCLYNGEKDDHLPGDPLLVKRSLFIKFEAKVPGGPHKIVMHVKLPEGPPFNGKNEAYKEFSVSAPEWKEFSFRVGASSSNDLYFYFDDIIMGDQPSSMQIRRILVRQV
jgi:hypothetical protein